MRGANIRRLMLCLLVAAAVVTSGDPVGACNCAGIPVCQVTDASLAVLGRPSAVFVGVVTEYKYPVTRFRVERMLVGEPAAELTLGPVAGLAAKAPAILSSCDLGFTLNERYLVYASRHNETGDLVTSQCSRTRRVSDPQAAADLAYFDARDAGRPTSGWLSGVVEERHYDPSGGPDGRVREWVVRPLSGIRVTATSPTGESRSTVTTERGWYVLTGLTPSAWQVMADLPAPFQPHDGMVGARFYGPTPAVNWFKGASCAEADIDVRVAGSIAGHILDDRGRPGRGVVVELGNAEALRTDLYAGADEEVVADEQGRFEFRPLPAGRYVVGVELDRPRMADVLDRRRYYPGVRQLTAATVIELDRGERLQLPTFRLPSLPAGRTITIVVGAPNPEVAAGTRVFLAGATKQLLNLSTGSIALQLPFGAAYDVWVEPPQGYRMEFRPSADPYRTSRERSILRDDTDRTIEITIVPR